MNILQQVNLRSVDLVWKVSIHAASRIDTRLGLGLGLGLASKASRVYLHRMVIHTATGEASRVYSISL